MLFAVDYNDNRVHIDETHSNQEYYCPYCGAPLTTKKGEIRQHHFAHKQNHCALILGSVVIATIYLLGTMTGNRFSQKKIKK